jgi:hypothetical protein
MFLNIPKEKEKSNGLTRGEGFNRVWVVASRRKQADDKG